MTTKTDGGAAFPVVHPDGMGVQYFGLSVRDYFAAKAMQAGLSTIAEFPDENWRVGLAIDAYAMADAMLAIRESKS